MTMSRNLWKENFLPTLWNSFQSDLDHGEEEINTSRPRNQRTHRRKTLKETFHLRAINAPASYPCHEKRWKNLIQCPELMELSRGSFYLFFFSFFSPLAVHVEVWFMDFLRKFFRRRLAHINWATFDRVLRAFSTIFRLFYKFISISSDAERPSGD